MRYDEEHESSHVVDERGRGGGVNPNLLVLLFRIALRFGIPGVVVFFAGLLCFGVVAGSGLLSGGVGGSGSGDPQLVHFVGFVLDDVQAGWTKEFAARHKTYEPADLVLFTGSTATGCGWGDAATGPFYCPVDERVYIDLSFYQELRDRFGAPGNFAQAYVIAHEVGHHVQKLLGTTHGEPVAGANGSSVRLELQADCYAGIWGRWAQGEKLLEPGDVEGALTAASAIGDDRLQKAARGHVSPDTFTHGTADQRVRWFGVGYKTGSVEACDTFKAPAL